MEEKRVYSEAFKESVVRHYLDSPHGIRIVARSFNLASKNYITRWMKELVDKGTLTPQDCLAKTKSFMNADKVNPYESHAVTARERQLEQENERLRAEVAFLKKLKELERRDAHGR